jgi:hypothetical protein
MDPENTALEVFFYPTLPTFNGMNGNPPVAGSTVRFAAVANVQNPDDVRLLIDETNSPVSHAQPQLAPLTCQHLYVARAGLGKPVDGPLHLVPVAVW